MRVLPNCRQARSIYFSSRLTYKSKLAVPVFSLLFSVLYFLLSGVICLPLALRKRFSIKSADGAARREDRASLGLAGGCVYLCVCVSGTAVASLALWKFHVYATRKCGKKMFSISSFTGIPTPTWAAGQAGKSLSAHATP